MKSLRDISLGQRAQLVGAGVLIGFGLVQLVRYTLGYSISFGVPGTSLIGTGSKVASVYVIISVVGVMLFRRVYDKLPASSSEA